jgi:Mn-dependent DtxR family transcriptional regulator
VPARTSSLFAALGQEGALDVVVLLLKARDGESVGGIQGSVDLAQATVTRRLQELAAAGLLEHERRGKPFRLREGKRVTKLLRDASELAERLLELDQQAERAFRDRLSSRP